MRHKAVALLDAMSVMSPTDSRDLPSQVPPLILGGLSVWVLDKAFPESVEWYDGSWLQVRAECAAPGATVTANGPLLTAEDIGRLLAGMEAMHGRGASSAGMSPLEPNLAVSLTGSSKGRLRIDVRITPDSMTQEHRFFFDADVAYLAGPIEQCRAILRRFPAVETQGLA
jgi:hypothetical protein